MARVDELINSVKQTLMELGSEGVRWRNAELVHYLNDAYRFVSEKMPEAFTDNSEFICDNGTRQRIPQNADRLIHVVRNLSGRRRAIQAMELALLTNIRPQWQSELPSTQIELYCYDERDAQHFYVYPPALDGTVLEIICAITPGKHVLKHYSNKETPLLLGDRYYHALLNYVLHRCFDKDADDAGNAMRAQNYLQLAYNALDVKLQNSLRNSPNEV